MAPASSWVKVQAGSPGAPQTQQPMSKLASLSAQGPQSQRAPLELLKTTFLVSAESGVWQATHFSCAAWAAGSGVWPAALASASLRQTSLCAGQSRRWHSTEQ